GEEKLFFSSWMIYTLIPHFKDLIARSPTTKCIEITGSIEAVLVVIACVDPCMNDKIAITKWIRHGRDVGREKYLEIWEEAICLSHNWHLPKVCDEIMCSIGDPLPDDAVEAIRTFAD